jgi:hypothetical protein
LISISPGLEIEGIGLIEFPLNALQFQQIKKQSEQTPYRNGVQEIAHTPLQLHPSKIKLNSAFLETLREIKSEAIAGLVVGNRPVRFELYKLLVYYEGSFLETYATSEDAGKGVFARLVVLLPSIYEGGEIIVDNDCSKQVVDFSKQNR